MWFCVKTNVDIERQTEVILSLLAQIKRLFEEDKLVSGDSEAIREFSVKYVVPQKLVADKNAQREGERGD